ncbi:FAD-dependent oxidoreductase [Nocardia higoensis]|uniref:FAD-dependent oxidoreductase n=1 Tax=Nocardia higoensis TaxID=228599 RepID=UPI000305BDA3|nr:FAD-dependent oxidoreductase [Nocardia higoensis]
MAHVVTQPCCNDASCVAVCPVDCIRPRPDEPGYARAELLHIDPATCIDCGACIEECPVDAIVPDTDLTPLDAPFLEINAAYFVDSPIAGTAPAPSVPAPALGSGPLRVAIVGSGPSACYAAEELLAHRDLDLAITMFERLPTPLGLVRYGVAPDHQKTKAVAQAFGRTLNRKELSLELNVEVGVHISEEELLDFHHAVVYATGAARGRELGIPGEDLPGVHPASDFVAWYNGHPDHAAHRFDFSAERAVIVGNGNVALDIARILVSDPATLARTDIADHALEALSQSRIREVVIAGRRDPAAAACTVPELLGLGRIPGVDIVVGRGGTGDGMGEVERGDYRTRLKTRMIADFAAGSTGSADKRIRLEFLRSPQAVHGQGRVESIDLAHNEPIGDGSGAVRATGEVDRLECGLVLTAVGYRPAPMAGVPLRADGGAVAHDLGRVVGADGAPVPGRYVTGWAKRGPSGVIGTNKPCSAESMASLLADFAAGALSAPTRSLDELEALLAQRQPLRIGKQGWKAIDAAERRNGRAGRRPRVKFVDTQEMLGAAGALAANL